MKKRRSKWTMAAASALWAVLAAATGVAGASAFPGPDGTPGDGMRGEDLRETIEIYMLAKMKRELQLTPEQEQEVVPLFQELSEARHRHRTQRRMTLMKLQPLVEDPSTPDEVLRTELESLDRSEKAFRTAEVESLERIRQVLTPRQEAQFVLFLERFMRDMRERLRMMRGMHGAGDGPGGDVPPHRRRGRPGDRP